MFGIIPKALWQDAETDCQPLLKTIPTSQGSTPAEVEELPHGRSSTKHPRTVRLLNRKVSYAAPNRGLAGNLEVMRSSARGSDELHQEQAGGGDKAKYTQGALKTKVIGVCLSPSYLFFWEKQCHCRHRHHHQRRRGDTGVQRWGRGLMALRCFWQARSICFRRGRLDRPWLCGTQCPTRGQAISSLWLEPPRYDKRCWPGCAGRGEAPRRLQRGAYHRLHGLFLKVLAAPAKSAAKIEVDE